MNAPYEHESKLSDYNDYEELCNHYVILLRVNESVSSEPAIIEIKPPVTCV